MASSGDVPIASAIALAVAASVVTYVTFVRNLQLGDVEFLMSAAALLFALWLVASPPFTGPWTGPFTGPWMKGRRREGFLDSAVAIVSDVIGPSLDRLVLGITGKNPDGSDMSFGMESVGAPSSAAGAAAAAPAEPPPNVKITADRFRGVEKENAKRLQLEYKRISYLLCRMSELSPDRYARLIAA